jgi:O-acetyl-ADP-ribose deacetylase (regulator of RNase III)
MEQKACWNRCAVHLHQGDITALAVDAIVNAANKWLQGGGGVDGAIHRRGGPAILAACHEIIAERGRPLETGQAVLTPGGRLPARHVIHTVGPIYHAAGEHRNAAELLADCYRNSLALVRKQSLRSVAFPCISTGAYGYPSEAACSVALVTVREELKRHGACEQVIFCVFGGQDFAVYQRAFERKGTTETSGTGPD